MGDISYNSRKFKSKEPYLKLVGIVIAFATCMCHFKVPLQV